MSKLDEIIYRIGSPWGEGATYDKSRTPEYFKQTYEEMSSHMSKAEEESLKADIKALMLEIVNSSRNEHEIREEVEKL